MAQTPRLPKRVPVAVAFLSCSLVLGVQEARAEPSTAVAEVIAARTRVVFATLGVDAAPARRSLASLLRVELERSGLSLAESEPASPLSEWATQVASSPRVLAVLLLDGRSAQGWRLIVIDAARGRAIARELPGGVSYDAAAVEAVVSIALSAANALREGLEVASSPLESVVGPPQLASARVPAAKKEPRSNVKQAPPITRPWSARAFVGASVASFSSSASTTEGIAVGLGLSFRDRIEARLLGDVFAPAKLSGPLGEFRVGRTIFGAAAGPVFATRSFSFSPSVGVAVERLSRSGAAPSTGVVATESASFSRVGGLLSLRLRHTLLPPLAVELVTGTAYLGRPVRFSARSAESTWSAEAWPTVAFAQLGLELKL